MTHKRDLPEKIQNRILRSLDPPELLLVATLVSKRWRSYIQTNFPRVLLLNLRLIVDKSDESPQNNNTSSPSSSSPDAGLVSNITVDRPTPLPAFCPIPVGLRDQFGAAVAGEGLAVSCKFRHVPTSLDGLRRFVDSIKSVLKSWNAVTDPQIHILPWEVQVAGDGLKTPEQLRAFTQMLAYLDPRILKVAFPPRILLHLLPPNITVLHLITCPHFIEPIDFSPFKKLQQSSQTPLFGSSLTKLILDSKKVDGEESDLGLVEPEDLEDIRFLSPTLRELVIGGFYPVLSYKEIVPILTSLKSLYHLSIKGLDQSEIAPQELAAAFVQLSNLEQLHDLCNVDKTFWMELLKMRVDGQAPQRQLKELTLLWDHPNIQDIRASLFGVATSIPTVTHLNLDVTALSASADSSTQPPTITITSADLVHEVASVLEAMGPLHKSALKLITIIGDPSLADLSFIGRANMKASELGLPTMRVRNQRIQ